MSAGHTVLVRHRRNAMAAPRPGGRAASCTDRGGSGDTPPAVPRQLRRAGTFVVPLVGGRMAAGRTDFRTACADRCLAQGARRKQMSHAVANQREPAAVSIPDRGEAVRKYAVEVTGTSSPVHGGNQHAWPNHLYAAGGRHGAHGDGLCGRAHLRRPDQPGSDDGCAVARPDRRGPRDCVLDCATGFRRRRRLAR
jgi:hypothetical protein